MTPIGDISAEHTVVNSFVSNIIEVRHLSEIAIVLTQMIHLKDF